MPTAAIEVEKLTKHYGAVTAIENVTLSVGHGEVVGFLGPNGAGKSTTMRIIAGLMTATSGVVRVSGVPVAWDPETAKRHLGYMPENNPLPEELRVTEYLRWRAKLKGVRRGHVTQRVNEVMEACDLVRKARRRLIGTLSKGFRQRVGIADALLGAPDVIILDEPTIGLDPHQILSIRKLINSLRGKTAVLISSHILAEVEQVCDRVIIINQGHIVASGTPDALRAEFLPEAKFELTGTLTTSALETLLLPLEPNATFQDKGQLPAGSASAGTGTAGTAPLRHISIHLPATSPLAPALLEKIWTAFPGKVRELHSTKATLEEIFIAATRRSWEIQTKLGHQ
jgi:ABC-2 type transport system ATP-binding protein